MDFLCSRPAKKGIPQRTMEDIRYDGPKWVQDHVAHWCCNTSCSVEFNLFVRKHHCRHCGKVFCDNCSKNKRALVKFGFLKPVRLCDSCNVACFRADLLLNAVGLNDLSTVEKICDEGNLAVSCAMGESTVQCLRCGMAQAAGSGGCVSCGAELGAQSQAVTASDHAGITPLHAAVQRAGHVEVVVALLEGGASVDALTAKALLERGADPSLASRTSRDSVALPLTPPAP